MTAVCETPHLSLMEKRVCEQQQQQQTMELQCVGSMQVQRTLTHGEDTQSELGFICGSLPVPTVSPPKAFSSTTSEAVLVSAIGPQSKRPVAPKYKLLPAETDLNSPPSLKGNDPENLVHIATAGDMWGGTCATQTVSKKCDALAVSALAGHGDEIDVIAPVDILKQIFRTPYSKARVSVAVHRIGRTLVLNSGPDNEEAEKLARRKKNNSKLEEKSLYSKFVRHSMHDTASGSESTPDFYSEASAFDSWQVIDGESDEACATLRLPAEQKCKSKFPWKDPVPRSRSRTDSIHKSTLLGEEKRMQQDPDRHSRASDGFLRVLFWQFQNLRMLLGSDLLVFSNDKHVAVSLHLIELERQVNPLMWLDAWLDNVMASVPELAICYHHNGVVQGYELLKTDDIFSLKGLAEDGTAFFQPHIVQQNALSVLRFLQENCKHDPGTYWLFKNANEDVLQLFDLTSMSKGCDSDEEHNTLPSRNNDNRSRYTLPLALLLYRIAESLSASKDSSDMCRCTKLFRKCLEFLDEEEHLVVRACAHEQVARLILSCCKEHGMTMKPLLLLESYQPEDTLSVKSVADEEVLSTTGTAKSVSIQELASSTDGDSSFVDGSSVDESEQLAVCEPFKPVPDSVSARLAAVHHFSQAIISLRWQRLHDVSEKEVSTAHSQLKQFPLCLCGDIECITLYDISGDEIGAMMEQKLRDLIVMLGESYLALGDAYKEQGQLSRAVKSAELACFVYRSAVEGNRTTVGTKPSQASLPRKRMPQDDKYCKSVSHCEIRKGQFWGQLWRLIGDVYIENLQFLARTGSLLDSKDEELEMDHEIVKEVKRLRKKTGQKQGCGVCSSIDCSCRMDRVSSASYASSSTDSSSSNTNSRHYRKPVRKVVTDRENEVLKPAKSSDCKHSICFHLQKVLTGEFEVNLLAAVDCYDAAAYALSDIPGNCQEVESVVRKKGWAWNELARRKVEMGDFKVAETVYSSAMKAFREANDVTNVVYVSMNLGQAWRARAEVVAERIGVSGSGVLDISNYVQMALEVKELYEESLKFYQAARQEASESNDVDLQKEVVRQLGNTYLRLGMFLGNQERVRVVYDDGEKGRLIENSKSSKLQRNLSANDAIREALELFESLGSERAQEAAYAHFQLACYQRDCCNNIVQYETLSSAKEKTVQRLKRYESLADRHWQKALEYYLPDTHPSMFLEIIMQKSALCLRLEPFLNSNQMFERAVSYMLEGRRVMFRDDAIFGRFQRHLQSLLKAMLSAALQKTSKTSGGGGGVESCCCDVRAGDVALVKQMYVISLRSEEGFSTLTELHRLWVS